MQEVKRVINQLAIMYPSYVTDSPDHDVIANRKIKEEDGTENTYSGQMLHDQRDGVGMQHYADGARYEG